MARDPASQQPATMTAKRILRLGTRSSALARWQADWVTARLGQIDVPVEQVLISTKGDREQAEPVRQFGGQGVFTKELQRSLLDGEIDLAVHSLKDLPTEPVEGLALGAVPQRGPAGDVLISREGFDLNDLPEGALFGTGSTRRRAQLLHQRPDLRMHDIRGNVDTRLRKLAEGQFDAIVLAEAGVTRLGLESHITEVISRSVMLPAPGQGALGIEVRADDAEILRILSPLAHPATQQAVTAERTLLATLRAGCLAPVGAWGRIKDDGELHLSGVVLSLDGRKRLEVALSGRPDEPAQLGTEAADELIAQGAIELIEASRPSD
jgi:hydroxymethylbilane synthase